MGKQLKVSEKVEGLTPSNMGELYTLATKISNSSLAPKDYKGKPDDTAIAMLMGLEIGLNPMQAIQNIAVINGRPSIWGDALLALVQNHPSFKTIAESFNDKDMVATCIVTRKGGKPHTQTFSKADAETAGLWGRNTWKQYPKRMLAMRARGFALRNQFADALLGLITAEEAYDMPVDDSTGEELPHIDVHVLKESDASVDYTDAKQVIKECSSMDELGAVWSEFDTVTRKALESDKNEAKKRLSK